MIEGAFWGQFPPKSTSNCTSYLLAFSCVNSTSPRQGTKQVKHRRHLKHEPQYLFVRMWRPHDCFEMHEKKMAYEPQWHLSGCDFNMIASRCIARTNHFFCHPKTQTLASAEHARLRLTHQFKGQSVSIFFITLSAKRWGGTPRQLPWISVRTRCIKDSPI